MRAGEGDGKRMFWVEKNQKLAQKGCFRTKENENCHRILHI